MKLCLYDALSSYQVDYSIGVEPYNMFFTIPSTTNGFKFYGNAINRTTISGTGNITTSGVMASASAQITDGCTVGGFLTVTGSLVTNSCLRLQTICWILLH